MSLPIAFTSAVGAIGCCAAAGCALPGGPPPPPPPGGPPPLPGGPPPPGGPVPLPFPCSTFCMAEAILCCGVGIVPKAEVVAVVVGAMVCVLMVGCSVGSVPLMPISGLVHIAGSIGVCLISWLTVASSSISGSS